VGIGDASPMPTPPLVAVRRLALARFISVAGSMAAYTALIDLMYVQTDGSSWVLAATVLLTIGAVGLFEPLGGWVADRMDRKQALIWSDLAGAAAFVAMAFVTDEPALLLFVALISAVVETPFRAGSVAAVPALVGDGSLITKANGWIGVGTNLGLTLGPAAGGLLAAWLGAGPVFLINGATFLISALLVVWIDRPFRDAGEPDEDVDLAGGFRFLARDRILLVVTLAWMVLVLGMGMGIIADRPVAEVFGAGAIGFGLMLGAFGAGSVVGSYLASRGSQAQEPPMLVAGFVIAGLAGLGIWVAPVFWVVVLCNLAWGAGDAVTIVAEQGIIQRRTPDALRSRVVAANEALVHAALIGGFLVAAPALDAIGPQAAYAVGGAAALVAAVMVLAVFRSVREDAGSR
jgi:MFS family permease